MAILKEEFQAWEKVRRSGLTNMFDVRMVMDLSGLSKAQCIEIMKTYEELCEQYPDVRDLS